MDKIEKGLIALMLDFPFFGSLICRMGIEQSQAVETMQTDGKTVRFNPAFVDRLSQDEVTGVLAHEVMHVAMGHHVRRDGRDMERWQVACDYAINPILVDAGLTLPEGGLLSDEFSGKSAEQIYTSLPSDEPGENEPGGDGGNQPPSQDPGGCGSVADFPGEDGGDATDAEKQIEGQKWEQAVVQAAQQSDMMGKLPGFADRWRKAIREPAVNWREALRDFLSRESKNDYNWSRPNRRYIQQGIILPSLNSRDNLGEIAIAIDTSGSVDQVEIDQFLAEVSWILEDMEAEIHFLPVDTEVHEAKLLTKEDLPLIGAVSGGGGTSFKPPFEYLERNDIHPTVLIYLTDGYCDEYPDDPGYPVLWISTRAPLAPPFGEYVKMEVNIV